MARVLSFAEQVEALVEGSSPSVPTQPITESVGEGEWWIDSSGYAQYADGDIGDQNHAGIAFETMLSQEGLDLEDPDTPELIAMDGIDDETAEWLREEGVDEKIIKFIQDAGDPREWAMQHMGWIRLQGQHAQLWEWNDDSLSILKDGLYEAWELDEEIDPDDSVMVEEYKTNDTFEIPLQALMNDRYDAKALRRLGVSGVLEPATTSDFLAQAWKRKAAGEQGFTFESMVEGHGEKWRLEQEVMKRLQRWPKYNAEIFYNPELQVLHVSYGDWEEAAEDPTESDYPSTERVETLLLAIEGVNQVAIEAEAGPDEGRWVKLDWKASDTPIVDPPINPNGLDHGGRGLDGGHNDPAYMGNSAYLARGESFKSIVELAEPLPSHTETDFYHATSDEASGQAILKDGYVRTSEPTKRGRMVPRGGYAYISPSIQSAAIYALGGVFLGEEYPEEHMGDRYGYIFEVSGQNLQDVDPDEDNVGGYLADLLRNDEYHWLAQLANQILRSSTIRRVRDGEYAYWASAGKQLLRKMTDEQKQEVMQDLSDTTHLAHKGNLPWVRAWKLDKTRSEELEEDGSNLFEVADLLADRSGSPVETMHRSKLPILEKKDDSIACLAEPPPKGMLSQDKKVLKQLQQDKYPATAEEDDAYVFHWADGRGICAFKHKKDAVTWINDEENHLGSGPEIVNWWYGPPYPGKNKRKKKLRVADSYKISKPKKKKKKKSESFEEMVESFSTQKKRFVQQGVDPEEITSVFDQFKQLKKKNMLDPDEIDIDRYKDFQSVVDAVQSKEGQQSKSQQKKVAKSEGAELVWEDEDYKVYHITTWEASKLYGKGTKWCISAHHNTHWKDITATHTIYMAIPKNETVGKVAIAVGPDDPDGLPTFYDAADKPMVVTDELLYPAEMDVFKYIEPPPPSVEDKSPGELIDYMVATGITNWPEAEAKIATDAEAAYEYAKKVIGGRFPAGEAAMATDPASAGGYAINVLDARFPEGEAAIATDPQQAYFYARFVLDGNRFPEGEAAIASTADTARDYAKYVIGARWPEGEAAIAASPHVALVYAEDFGERFPAGEAMIAAHPGYAYTYAANVIEGRWPEGEAVIATEPRAALLYAINIIEDRWPEGEAAIMKHPLDWEYYNKQLGPKVGPFESMVEAEEPGIMSIIRQAETGLDRVKIFWPSREIWHYYVPTGIFDKIKGWKNKSAIANQIKAKAVKSYEEMAPDFETASLESMGEASFRDDPSIQNIEQLLDDDQRWALEWLAENTDSYEPGEDATYEPLKYLASVRSTDEEREEAARTALDTLESWGILTWAEEETATYNWAEITWAENGIDLLRQMDLLPGQSVATIESAIKSFGTTDDPREAGYLLPDGQMLDFSGKREGGTAGSRAYDHRDIGRAGGPGGTEGMMSFAADTGSIRMSIQNYATFDIYSRPTRTQNNMMDDMMADSNYEGAVDVTKDGQTIHGGEVSNKRDFRRIISLANMAFMDESMPSFAQLMEQEGWPDSGDDPLVAALEGLYEAEYKYSTVKVSDWRGEQPKDQVLVKLASQVEQYGREAAELLLPVYEDWLAKHALSDPVAWAKARREMYGEEQYGEADWSGAADAIASEYYNYAYNQGQGAGFNPYGGNPNYEGIIVADLFGKHKPEEMPAWAEWVEAVREDYVAGYEEDPEEPDDVSPYAELSDFWPEYSELTQGLTEELENAANHLGDDHAWNMLEEILRVMSFPAWFAHWEEKGIVETRERVQGVYDELRRVASGGSQSPEDTSKAVNIGLNTAHQTGSMMDYIEEQHPEVTREFLDSLSNKDTSDWDNELIRLGAMSSDPGMFGKQAIKDLWLRKAAGESIDERFATARETPHGYAEVFVDPSWKEMSIINAGSANGARAWLIPGGPAYLWDADTGLHQDIAELLEREELASDLAHTAVSAYIRPDAEAQSAEVELALTQNAGGLPPEQAKVAVVGVPWIKETFPRGVSVRELGEPPESEEFDEPDALGGPEDFFGEGLEEGAPQQTAIDKMAKILNTKEGRMDDEATPDFVLAMLKQSDPDPKTKHGSWILKQWMNRYGWEPKEFYHGGDPVLFKDPEAEDWKKGTATTVRDGLPAVKVVSGFDGQEYTLPATDVMGKKSGLNLLRDDERERTKELLTQFSAAKKAGGLKGNDANIDSYKSVEDLDTKIDELAPEDFASKKQLKRGKAGIEATPGVELAAETENFKTYKVESELGCRLMARGTEWCTKDPKYARQYLNDGPLFVVYAKQGEHPDKKIAQHTQDGTQFMNVEDDDWAVSDILQLPKDVYELFSKVEDEHNAVMPSAVEAAESAQPFKGYIEPYGDHEVIALPELDPSNGPKATAYARAFADTYSEWYRGPNGQILIEVDSLGEDISIPIVLRNIVDGIEWEPGENKLWEIYDEMREYAWDHVWPEFTKHLGVTIWTMWDEGEITDHQYEFYKEKIENNEVPTEMMDELGQLGGVYWEYHQDGATFDAEAAAEEATAENLKQYFEYVDPDIQAGQTTLFPVVPGAEVVPTESFAAMVDKALVS